MVPLIKRVMTQIRPNDRSLISVEVYIRVGSVLPTVKRIQTRTAIKVGCIQASVIFGIYHKIGPPVGWRQYLQVGGIEKEKKEKLGEDFFGRGPAYDVNDPRYDVNDPSLKLEAFRSCAFSLYIRFLSYIFIHLGDTNAVRERHVQPCSHCNTLQNDCCSHCNTVQNDCCSHCNTLQNDCCSHCNTLQNDCCSHCNTLQNAASPAHSGPGMHSNTL